MIKNIQKIVGSQFKDITSMENFHHLAMEFIRDDICNMCYDNNEDTTIKAVIMIQEYIYKDTEACIKAWAFIVKFLSLLAKSKLSSQLLIQL